MRRLNWPNTLELGMVNPLPSGFLSTQQTQDLNAIGYNIPLQSDGGIAIALRWRLHPWVGIPRAPFSVWKRQMTDGIFDNQLSTIIRGRFAINGIKTFKFDGKAMYRVYASVSTSRYPLLIQALDVSMRPILGECIVFPANSKGIIRFKCPNIHGIFASGDRSTITNVWGESMHTLINSRRWNLIETVGLPLDLNSVHPDVYNSSIKQGTQTNLLEPPDAALQRLSSAKILLGPAPAATGGVTPNWPQPAPEDILSELRDFPESPLILIQEMLANTEDKEPYRAFRQSAYEKKIVNDGIHQPGRIPKDKSEFGINVVGNTLLSVATDMWSSLGLGFGTTDIGDLSRFIAYDNNTTHVPDPDNGYKYGNGWLSSYNLPDVDYMVTVPVTLPLGLRFELAAVACISRYPASINSPLEIQHKLSNRPFKVDQKYAEEVALSWERLTGTVSPHGYVIAKRVLPGGPPHILNEKRLLGNSYTPYISATPEEATLEQEETSEFVDDPVEVPYSGSERHEYFVNTLDVFGRWGSWKPARYSFRSKGPGNVKILNASINPDLPTGELDISTITNRVLPATLIVEFLWDWEDRSPASFELVGKFVSATTNELPTTIPSRLISNPNGRGGEKLIIQFAPDLIGPNAPNYPDLDMPTSNFGQVVLMDQDPGEGFHRKYRWTYPGGLSLDFSNESNLAYVIYARAAEKVNPSAYTSFLYIPPQSIEPFIPQNTKIIRVKDPLPAQVPVIVPDLRWATLPDVNGDARFTLSFPSAIAAAGYHVYEATEAAMRVAAGLPPINSSDLVDRARDLTLVENAVEVRDTFSRLRAKAFETSEIEVTVPGATEGLYAYCISSISAEQIESKKSSIIYVAVPKQIRPGTPVLELHASRESEHLHVQVAPGNGPSTAGIHLFRRQSPFLKSKVSLMGAPIVRAADPAWNLVATDKSPFVDAETQVFSYFEYLDNLEPSWFPYFYRAVAIGPHDPSNGIYAGKSLETPVREFFLPPLNPPDLQPIILIPVSNPDVFQIEFKSSATIRPTPKGNHLLEIATVDRSTPEPIYQIYDRISLHTTLVPSEPLEEKDGTVYRKIEPDDEGRYTYIAFVHKNHNEVRIRLIDPLGRKSEQTAPLIDPVTRLPFTLPGKFDIP